MISYTDKITYSIKKKIVKFPLISKENPIENIKKDCYIIIALEKKEIIGYILLEKPIDSLCFNIQYLEVEKNYQNKGIGTKLMDKIINYIKEKKGDKITLISLGNSGSFFRKFGFIKKKGFLMELIL